jgi:hypothetical protein
MSNLKISQLPEFTGNTSGSYLVMNNSGETTTYKVKKENYVFPYNGDATITGSLNVNGNARLSGSLTINASAPSGSKFLNFATYESSSFGAIGASIIYSPAGGLGNGTLNILPYVSGSTVRIGSQTQGTKNILFGKTDISGSLTVSGSASGVGNGLNVIGNTQLSGSLSIQGSSDAATKYIFFAAGSGSLGALIQYTSAGVFSILQQPTGSNTLQLGNVSGSNEIFGNTRHTGSLTVTGSLNVSSLINTAPLYIGTGSIYSGSTSNVSGSYGDIRMMYNDDGYRQLYAWAGTPPGDWNALI